MKFFLTPLLLGAVLLPQVGEAQDSSAPPLLISKLDALHETGSAVIESGKHYRFQLRGWTVNLNRELWETDREKVEVGLEILSEQADRVIEVLPASKVARLRQVPLWINPPFKGTGPGAAYHPNITWLRENGRDPAMAKAIEMTNVSILPLENRRMPYFLLHELAHAYHDQVLGFEEPRIKAAFETARDSGGYEKVKRFNGKSTFEDKAYAMTNHKEYFAESTEAFFGQNDFFPFNREELKQHDPTAFQLLEAIWKDS